MDGVSFECMEVISSGTETVAKLAFNWARQGQSAAMAFMFFVTKTRDKFSVSNEFHRLANQQHTPACIVAPRRTEGRMEHRRYEPAPRTYAHHRHGQWSDSVSGNPFRGMKWNSPCSIFANNPLLNAVRITSCIDEASHRS